MTMPELTVEIGFTAPLTGSALHLNDRVRGRLDTATLAADDLFTDVTQWVQSVSTRRGATRADGPNLRFESGSATLVLDNSDRRFDPTNLAGPYVAAGQTQVEPMRAIRVRATDGDETWPVFRGFAQDWQVDYTGPNSSQVTVVCADAFAVFASYDPNASGSVGAGEDSGARINRILDSVAWSGEDRVIATGDTTVQATTLAQNVLSELLLTADTELGEFYMDAQGRAVFRNRRAILTETRSARPCAAFGDEPTDGVATTINLASNPSAETSLSADWAGGGFANPPTLTRDNTRAMFGTWSVLATWATAIPADLPLIQYAAAGLTAGKTYTFSVYAYVPAGSPSVACVIATTGPWGTGTAGAVDQWVRLTLTTTVASSSVNFQVWPENSTTTAGQQVWLDGLQVEESDTATDYVDGDQTNCEWDGVAHTSTSRRLPELPYADVAITYDDQSIYNLFSIGRAGGTVQVAENTASRTAYLTRTYGRSDLLMETDTEAGLYARYIRHQSQYPELRFSQLTLRPQGDIRLWGQALGREIGDRIRIFRRPPGGGAAIEREVFVRGVEHEVTPGTWTTKFVLQSATRFNFIVLDNPTLGRLDYNAVAY